MIDVGANLTHAAFRADLDKVVVRARDAGVAPIVVTGTTVDESRSALEIASRFDLYATAGVHPHHARDCSPATISEIRGIASHPRVVATVPKTSCGVSEPPFVLPSGYRALSGAAVLGSESRLVP